MVELIEHLPEIRPDFLERAIAAYDQAVLDGASPREWQLTKALFNNLAPGTGWWTEAQRTHIGKNAPETLGRLPVLVTAGAHHQWELVCAGGVTYRG